MKWKANQQSDKLGDSRKPTNSRRPRHGVGQDHCCVLAVLLSDWLGAAHQRANLLGRETWWQDECTADAAGFSPSTSRQRPESISLCRPPLADW